MNTSASVVQRILTFNEGRIPAMLQLKYKAMRIDAFAFLRGTCHLFYEDWPADSALNSAPPVWICGDFHLENVGSYKGDNRLTYFDINDFDEAALAPCTWDMARLTTSILVAAGALKMRETNALKVCQVLLESFRQTLAKGRAGFVERATAQGMVKDLLRTLKARKRREFLARHTNIDQGTRALRIDHVHFLPISKAERRTVKKHIEEWGAAQQQYGRGFFRVLDVARRVAGTGSLGVERYAVLVEGKGSPDHNFILDLKEECPSSLVPYLKVPQPQWENEAERTVAIQERCQAVPPAMLDALQIGDKAYLLRELQPLEDRVNLATWDGKEGRLEKLLQTLGALSAWAALRSSGRQGSATADELIQFAQATDWPDAIIDYARTYAGQVRADYKAFCAAYDGGKLS